MFFHIITITPAVLQSLAKVQIILDHEISLSILKQSKTTSHLRISELSLPSLALVGILIRNGMENKRQIPNNFQTTCNQ
jgi:hypothetical protein